MKPQGSKPDAGQPKLIPGSYFKQSSDAQRRENDEAARQSVLRRLTGGIGITAPLTPLEKQILDVKSKNDDILVLIEVGYKYRFYGEDAVVASKILDIAHFKSHNFITASIPTHRLRFHVRKLVDAGHVVGVVKQVETAALKAKSDSKNQPFKRQLTSIYTKATFIPDDEEEETNSRSRPIMSICEDRGNRPPNLAIVSFNVTTGEIWWDEFNDTSLGSQLEARLVYLEPCEIVICNQISTSSKTLIDQYSRRFPPLRLVMSTLSQNDIDNFKITLQNDIDAASRSSKFERLPTNVQTSAISLSKHLLRFNLETALYRINCYKHLADSQSMLLNHKTIYDLNLINYDKENENRFYTVNSSKHVVSSLFEIFNLRSPAFAVRLLKDWITRPLRDLKLINQRFKIVDEVLTTKSPFVRRLSKFVKNIPDLEKILAKIQYANCNPKETVKLLSTLEQLANLTSRQVEKDEPTTFFEELEDSLYCFKSKIDLLLMQIDRNAAQNDKLADMFINEDLYPEIFRMKLQITVIEGDLESLLQEYRSLYNIPQISYCTVIEEYLLRVPNEYVKHVPRQWIKISGTKLESRFRSPETSKLLEERERQKEMLDGLCISTYQEFLSKIAVYYDQIYFVIKSIAEAAIYFSLAILARQPGYCKPKFVSNGLKIKNGVHPIIALMMQGRFVPNDTHFCEDQTGMIITGPNMGGKSCYARQVALLCIMAQIGSYVPAESMELAPIDGIFLRIGANDNIIQKQSTFMVEMSEVSEIMRYATQNSLVILDEVGRGTATHDGQSLAYAILYYFLHNIKAMTIFITHYTALMSELHRSENGANCPVRMYHMAYEKSNEKELELIFLYKLIDGITKESYGLYTALISGLPLDIIKRAKIIKQSFELYMFFCKEKHIKNSG